MFRRAYLAKQGQQFAGSAGGGFGFDVPIRYDFASLASTAGALIFKFPFFIVACVDITDFGASVLSDVEPLVQAPNLKVGRVQLALSVSQVSSASSPSYIVKRYRAGVSAAMVTYNGVTDFLDSFIPAVKQGTAISNGTLLAGDVLSLTIVSNAGGGAPVNSGTLLVDIEG